MRDIKRAAEYIKSADAILVSAANGFSITEGIHLFANNQALEDVFGDYKRKYGLNSLLQGMMGQWPSEEEKWAFWSRLVKHYCVDYKSTQLMDDLEAIVKEKDYFIITSNGEQHFELSGFDEDKIYEVEGDWLHLQCGKACHNEFYPWSELAAKMAEAQMDGKVPTEMIPHCPKCGAPMQIHAQIDHSFLPNEKANEDFQKFLRKHHGKKLVVLELGIGARNQLIKAPLMNLVMREENAHYITINLGELFIPGQISDRSVGLDGYLSEMLSDIRKELS